MKSAENLNVSLQSELDKLRSNESNEDWQRRYEALEEEFHQQQQITEEVRQDATKSLQEMRDLSERSLRGPENEQRLAKQVAQLEVSVNDWKDRYTKTRTQLRNLRATSMALYIQNPLAAQFAGQGGAAKFQDAKGMVRDVSVTHFQLSIEELLKITKSGEPKAPLDYMRNIVEAIRTITGDTDAASKSVKESEESSQRRAKLKTRISGAANTLITASKKHAQDGGLRPIGLIDAAAANLTTAVVDLIKVVKIRPSPVKELEDKEYA